MSGLKGIVYTNKLIYMLIVILCNRAASTYSKYLISNILDIIYNI